MSTAQESPPIVTMAVIVAAPTTVSAAARSLTVTLITAAVTVIIALGTWASQARQDRLKRKGDDDRQLRDHDREDAAASIEIKDEITLALRHATRVRDTREHGTLLHGEAQAADQALQTAIDHARTREVDPQLVHGLEEIRAALLRLAAASASGLPGALEDYDLARNGLLATAL